LRRFRSAAPFNGVGLNPFPTVKSPQNAKSGANAWSCKLW
jgi:hypothetical protein